jgi:REP element-mobilizing transposase RayT
MNDEEKFRGKYRTRSIRLQKWYYGWNGDYYVTICLSQRKYLFGEVFSMVMQLSPLGKLAEKFWYEIPVHFPFVRLGAFVVMPNHIHGIIEIRKNKKFRMAENGLDLQNGIHSPDHNKLQPIGKTRYQNQGKNTLSSIIGSYKSAVTRNARKINPNFKWQPGFYEHIIRDKNDYHRISKYILNNPRNWRNDRFYTARY